MNVVTGKTKDVATSEEEATSSATRKTKDVANSEEEVTSSATKKTKDTSVANAKTKGGAVIEEEATRSVVWLELGSNRNLHKNLCHRCFRYYVNTFIGISRA